MDGWSAALSQETREKLEAGAHPPSVYAVLTACGIYQNDGAKRWRFARAACARGWRTETVLGLVEAAFQPNASEGRVRAPGGLLRSWLEAPELEERRPPHLVGDELRAAQRARAALERSELESSDELADAAAEIAAAMGTMPRHERNARARGLGAALRLAIRDLADARSLTIQLDRCYTLPELSAFATLHPELDCSPWKPGDGARSSSSPKG